MWENLQRGQIFELPPKGDLFLWCLVKNVMAKTKTSTENTIKKLGSRDSDKAKLRLHVRCDVL